MCWEGIWKTVWIESSLPCRTRFNSPINGPNCACFFLNSRPISSTMALICSNVAPKEKNRVERVVKKTVGDCSEWSKIQWWKDTMTRRIGVCVCWCVTKCYKFSSRLPLRFYSIRNKPIKNNLRTFHLIHLRRFFGHFCQGTLGITIALYPLLTLQFG